jgi:F-type H+-transporting ATPase subunit b
MMLPLLTLLQDAAHAVEDTGHAAEGALPAPFSPTWGLFIWTMVVFIPLLFLLAKFVFPQLVKATAEREQRISDQLAEAARMRDEANAVLEEQRQLLAGARGEAQAILADARQAAERDRAAALEKTRAEQDEILARAKQELVSERDRLAAELRRETVDLAIAAAGKVVGQRLDAATDRQLVEQYLAELGKRA